MKAVQNSGALEYTHAVAKNECDAAMRCLEQMPDNDYKNALRLIAQFSIERNF